MYSTRRTNVKKRMGWEPLHYSFILFLDFLTPSAPVHLTMGHVTVQLNVVSLEDPLLALVLLDMEFVVFVSLLIATDIASTHPSIQPGGYIKMQKLRKSLQKRVNFGDEKIFFFKKSSVFRKDFLRFCVLILLPGLHFSVMFY